MPRALVMTVGTGTRQDTDITRPLLLSARSANPEVLVLLASEQSKHAAEKIAEEYGMGKCKTRILSDVDDLSKVYLEAREEVRTLIEAHGIEPHSIEADFTSGTKAMSAGLTMAAVSLGCGNLKYVSGQRRLGVVVNGTEKTITIQPTIPLMHSELETALRMALELDFQASLSVLGRINPDVLEVLDERAASMCRNLRFLVQAYHRWDLFDHRRFHEYYHKVGFDCPQLRRLRVANDVPARVSKLRNTIEDKEYTLDLLADLFNNAIRRGIQQRYDDAIARLYRVTEMVAQAKLKEFGIDTSDVDQNKVPERTRRTLIRDRNGKVRIGLDKAYDILNDLGHCIGTLYSGNERLRALIQTRNRSILAHGTQPMSDKEFLGLLTQVLTLLEMVEKSFVERARHLQFPWLLQQMESVLSSARA